MNEEEEKPKNKPLDEELKKQINFFITSPLKSADRLKKLLYKDDTFYRNTPYAWVGENDSKKLFFYGVCIEIGKACTELIQTGELIKEVPIKKEDGSEMGRIVHNSIIDKQNSLIRKLTELLTLVINFSKTTNEIEYRIFHSAQNLTRFLNQKKAFSDVYGVDNNNTQASIDGFDGYKKRIDGDIKLIQNKIPWFINEKNYRKLKLPIFKGWMGLYRDAIDLSNDDEKSMLGINHERYSAFSQSIHPTITSHGYESDEDWEMIIGNLRYIAMLSMHIMDRSYDLLGLKDEDGLKKIMGENFEKSVAPDLMNMFRKIFEVGDIVFVHSNDLAEVIECRKGKFDFTVYRVKYLSNPPLPEYPEEWIEGRRLTRIFSPGQIRPFFERSLEPSSKLPDMAKDAIKQMLNENDTIIIDLMKKTLASLHKDGVLTLMLTHSNIIKPINKKGGKK